MRNYSNKRKMFYGAQPQAFKNAYWLRKNETQAERILWEALAKNPIHGFRFKRQHPIGYYIVDFYCHRAKLVIEIDGHYHDQDEQKLHDELRTEEFEALGLRVIRFSNEEVLSNVKEVVGHIETKLNEK